MQGEHKYQTYNSGHSKILYAVANGPEEQKVGIDLRSRFDATLTNKNNSRPDVPSLRHFQIFNDNEKTLTPSERSINPLNESFYSGTSGIGQMSAVTQVANLL